ncbi:MAG TPA: TonB-dependent receptor [Pyrinomonadaceae bacterium]|nr:TonB-dependent receptor [Pyrinomonadaceae bacterium]
MTTNRRITRILSCVGALVLLLAVFALPTFAQTNKGTITGTVTDQNGGAVVGATVTVINVGTNAERTVTTDDSGNYEVPLLDPGNYRVTVTATSFKKTIQENVVLQTTARQPVDVVLQTGEVGAEVTVTAAPNLVESESSERSSVITGREVTELPLSGRNFTLLATLTPGVARASNAGFGGSGPDARQFNNGDPRAGSGGPNASNAQGDTPTARFARSGAGTLTVNGQRPTNNNFSLDGVDNNEPQFGTIGVFPNPDAIAEFKISTSVPPAEVGRASGAVINTTTKSGTNDFHGSLYYYGQNSALNAFHPILKRDRADAIARGDSFIPDKAVQQIHEYGGTVGGPLIKNKTFFFFDYLGQRNNIPFPFTSTVPTALSRIGNFTEFATCNGVKDPLTGLPFAGNIIPTARQSAIARRILALYPLPTRNIPCPSQGTANYAALRQNREQIDNFGIKIDHRFGTSNSLTGRFNNQNLKNVRENFFPVSLTGPPGLPTAGFGAGEEVGNTRQLVITDTHTFSPTLLNEFRFGLTKINIGINNCGVLGACGVSDTWSSDVGIPNSNLGTPETSGGLGLGTTGTGFVEFLGDGGLFRAKSTNPYFADTVTIIKGNNIIKAGGEARIRSLNTICGGCAGAEKGQIGFNDSNTGNAQGDMLLDLPNFAQRSRTIGGPFDLRMQEFGIFVQDDWKVNDRLTLNLGLRYDLLPGPTAPTVKDGRLSYYFPEDRQVVVAGSGGDRLVQLDRNNFGPRLGFAYSLNKEKTFVLRGGYGLLYTLDGVDYPPGVRNPPFTNISFSNFTLAQGPPVITTGIDPVNVPSGTSLFTVDRQQKNGMTHQFQLSMQYQFAREWSIDVGYVGNRSRNLLATLQEGSGGQGIARNLANQLIGSVLLYSNAAESSYDSLQVQVQKRLSNNIQGQVSYTWGHTIDNATGVFNGLGDSKNQGRNGPVNPFDLNFDRGNSVLDIRHLLSASAIIDVPFGKGQRFLNQDGPVNAIFGGWQMNVIVSGRSGFPFSVVCQNQLIRPVLNGDPFSNVGAGRFMSASAFLCSPPVVAANTDQFAQVNRNNPANAAFFAGLTEVQNAAGQTVRFGNLGRNSFTGPSIWNTDFSFFKNARLPFTENMRLQIGIELFNAFNHTNLTVPNNNATDLGAFGKFDGAYPGRVIQYRFKVLF